MIKDHHIARLASMIQKEIGHDLATCWNDRLKAQGAPPIYDSGDVRPMLVSKIKEWAGEIRAEEEGKGAIEDLFAQNMTPNPDCGCRKCNPKASWMVVCSVCGNKRCPKATDHDLDCTNSNEPGQKGSAYENIQPPKRDEHRDQT